MSILICCENVRVLISRQSSSVYDSKKVFFHKREFPKYSKMLYMEYQESLLTWDKDGDHTLMTRSVGFNIHVLSHLIELVITKHNFKPNYAISTCG